MYRLKKHQNLKEWTLRRRVNADEEAGEKYSPAQLTRKDDEKQEFGNKFRHLTRNTEKYIFLAQIV